MKTKIYLNDWYLNCGVVGFLKILEHNENQFATKRNNYIEIDTEAVSYTHLRAHET